MPHAEHRQPQGIQYLHYLWTASRVLNGLRRLKAGSAHKVNLRRVRIPYGGAWDTGTKLATITPGDCPPPARLCIIKAILIARILK